MTPKDFELLRPNQYCRDLSCIDFAELSNRGIRYFCIDLDNTLAFRNGIHALPHIAEALDRARRDGYIEDICVVSNIICGKKRRLRVQNIANELNINRYYAATFWDRKPSPKPFQSAMTMMGSTPENTACIGDQLFTDILGGNRLGLYSILVEPLGNDHWTTRLTGRRRREKRILEKLGLKCPQN